MNNTNNRQERALALFEAVLELPAAERMPWVQARCGADPELVRLVRDLLAADEQADAVATGAALALIAEEAETPRYAPGTRVGRYEIESHLGRGGMGDVYAARRNDGEFEQRVAIKFIAEHRASGAALERFRNERQILAEVDHPNIAKLLDGGSIGDEPYLVMELIDGAPFTHEPARPLPQTLALFINMCGAVHSLHNQLILHRDIKPANVLLTEAGEPKLLDFGVARVYESLSEAATGDLTGAGALPMTLNYAAPECLAGHSATVASEIYTLGAYLFELVHGGRFQDLAGLTLAEAQRRAGQHRPTDRIADPDLRAIINRATQRDPEARYSSVRELQDDLRALVAGRPVTARAQEPYYATRRFLKRHRVAVGASLFSAVTIVGLLLTSLLALNESRTQSQLATQQLATSNAAVGFLRDVLVSADPRVSQQPLIAIDDALAAAGEAMTAAFDEQPSARAYMLATLGEVYAGRGKRELAERWLDEAYAYFAAHREIANRAEVAAMLAEANFMIGRFEHALSASDEALALLAATEPPKPAQLARVLGTRGETLVSQGRHEEAETTLLRVVTLYEQGRVDKLEHVTRAYNGLAHSAGNRGDLAKALNYSETMLQLMAQGDLLTSSNGLQAQANHAGVLSALGRYDEAGAQYEQAISAMRSTLGAAHPWVLWATTSMGVMYHHRGDVERAVAVMEPLQAHVETLGQRDEGAAYFNAKFGYALCKAGRPRDGLPLLEKALASRRLVYPADNWNIPDAQSAIGFCQLQLGNRASATRELSEAVVAFERIYGPDHRSTTLARSWLTQATDPTAREAP